MAMQHMNKKGFLLVDSLITVFITSLVCVMCFSIYDVILNYEEGYENYQSSTNEEIEDILNNMWECEVCVIDESD